MQCVSFTPWMPHALGAMFFVGMAVGMCIHLGLDRAELAAYRRIASGKHEAR